MIWRLSSKRCCSSEVITSARRERPAEVLFNVEKRRLVEVYFEMYEHTADALEQHDLAQRITDVIVTRTRLDLEANNFNTAFFGKRRHPSLTLCVAAVSLPTSDPPKEDRLHR